MQWKSIFKKFNKRINSFKLSFKNMKWKCFKFNKSLQSKYMSFKMNMKKD